MAKKKSKGKKSQKKSFPANVKNRGLAKVEHAKRSLVQGVEQINHVINRLEQEVEILVKKIVKQGERSRRDLRKNFDEVITRLKRSDILAVAQETREEVEKEVRRIAEDIVEKVKEIELVPGKINLKVVVKDMRRSFKDLLGHLHGNGLVQRAKHTVQLTKKEMLSLLSIPTQDEVIKLEKKIVILEKRLSNLSRKAA